MNNQKKQTDRDVIMEDLGESLGYLQAFISQEIEGIKLEAVEKISIASSSIITSLALVTTGSFVLILGSVALGFYLGTVFNSNAIGFLIVAAIFLIFLLIIYFFRKVLITDKVVTAVIELFFDEKEKNEIH